MLLSFSIKLSIIGSQSWMRNRDRDSHLRHHRLTHKMKVACHSCPHPQACLTASAHYFIIYLSNCLNSAVWSVPCLCLPHLVHHIHFCFLGWDFCPFFGVVCIEKPRQKHSTSLTHWDTFGKGGQCFWVAAANPLAFMYLTLIHAQPSFRQCEYIYCISQLSWSPLFETVFQEKTIVP